jgi:transposase
MTIKDVAQHLNVSWDVIKDSQKRHLWKRVKTARAKVKAVTIDMSPAYISAVMEHLPKATLILDHFHIFKLFNEKLTEIRRKLYHQVSTTMEKNILKGTRWDG